MKKIRGIFIKNEKEIELLRHANRIVSRIHDAIADEMRPGLTTMHFEDIAQRLCREYKVKPAFQGYHGFPFALCASSNNEVVHGFPSAQRVLEEGDIVSFDMGVIYEGFYGDAARTLAVGKISAEAQRLIDVTYESLLKGIAQGKAGGRLYDISAAVQQHVEAAGFGVVKRFVGHGVGRALHEKPEVPNFVVPGLTGPDLMPGMVLAIEPMVTLGRPDVDILDDGWTAVTRDGSLAAHWEHSIAITSSGPMILSLSE